MQIDIKPVTRRSELKKYISLPREIHRDHKMWVPPIYVDEWSYYNPKKNKAFSYCDTLLALAYRGKQPVGRIMGIVNRRCNEHRNEKTARFGYLECYEDEEAAHALLSHVEDWARDKGMNKIVGPMGFTDQDPEGFLIDGFEHEPAITTYCNPEYIIQLLESKGYDKEVDYIVYKIKVFDRIPAVYEKIYQRISRRDEFRLVEAAKRKELKRFILPVLRLMNETFQSLYGYVALDEDEMKTLAGKYLPVIDPRFVKIITRDDQVVAFIIAIPNMNKGIRSAGGRLFPFGIFRIIRAARKTKQLDLLLGAIRKEYRGRGLDVLLGTTMMRAAKNAGFEFMDSHHELESNVKVRAEMEKVSGEIYKRYRLFKKMLYI